MSFYLLNLTNIPPSSAFTEFNSKRLYDTQVSTNSPTFKVILLGDSRLRYATATDAELSKALSAELQNPVVVTRIVNNWAVFSDFSDLREQILSATPDVIVIQHELLSKGRTPPARFILAREYWFWRYFGDGIWNPGRVNQSNIQNEMRCSVLNANETVEQRRERAFKWFHFSHNNVSRKKILQFLQQATEKNISLVFAAIPITQQAAAGLPSPIKSEGAIIKQIENEFTNEQFCDVVHMNGKGREIYSRWLIDTVAQELKANKIDG